MNVLSLFDGMSCGQISLNRIGISYDNYFASEVDKYAIKVTQYNFPNTVQLGDVTKVNVRADGIYVGDDYLTEDKISEAIPNLLIGGSPCQGFSFAGKQLNFEDPRSKLFFEYVRILNEIRKYNPDVLFLLENVKMKKEYQDIISEHMGCEPIKINSALVSAQNRERLYWTNIPVSSMPEDKEILLKDIIEHGRVDRNKSLCIDANYYKGGNENIYLNKSRRQIIYLDSHKYKSGLECVGALSSKKWVDDGKNLQRNFSQGERIYNIEGKSPTLNTMGGGNREPKIATDEKHYRKLTPLECERLQTVPDNYTACVSNSQRYKMLGNGWTVDVICHLLKNIDLI